MTLFKRSTELLQQLRAQLDAAPAPQGGPDSLQQQTQLQTLSDATAELSGNVAKMKAKAQEKDPDKQVYGKSMVDKILQLAADQEALDAAVEKRRTALSPLVTAETQKQQQAAAVAEQQRAEEQRSNEEAAAKKREKEEAQRRAAEAAAAEAAHLEKTRLEQAEQKRGADLAAAQEAARQKADAERGQLERAAKQRQEEILRKQEADLKVRQEAQRAAAAATAAARRAEPPSVPPPFNAAGDVIHLHGGQGELTDILRKAGERQLVVLDFSAAWCGPCRMMEPVLAAWGRELAPRVIFINCDAEAAGNRGLAASSGINAFPTFHIYRGGRAVGQVRGADRNGLRSMIDTETRLLAPLDRAPAGAVSAAVKLANAMSAMKAKVAPAVFQRAAETLLAYVRNLVANPQDPKFRRIKAANARYRSAVGSVAHGIECMAALGFRPVMEASEEILVLDEPSSELPRVKTLLEQAMAMVQRDVGALASAGSAAAARAAAASPPAAVPPAAAIRSGPAAAPAAPGSDTEAQARLMAQQLAAVLGGASSVPGGATPGTSSATTGTSGAAGASGGGSQATGAAGGAAAEDGATAEDDEELQRAIRESMKEGGDDK